MDSLHKISLHIKPPLYTNDSTMFLLCDATHHLDNIHRLSVVTVNPPFAGNYKVTMHSI